ncbi:MAG: restriction endonuclease [Burkholderiaceae bacterium]|nr:restriction endonuclease [Burkholderiaceae bacterium]
MPSTAQVKGDDLELAVRLIEDAILAAGYKGSISSYEIESKKIVVVQGVRHEIDLFVKMQPAPGYESHFIFECKNWAANVGKNEIIVFAEKVRCLNVSRGYFVARDFTKDAVAQANINGRISLLRADIYEPVQRIAFPFVVASNIKTINARLGLRCATGERLNGLTDQTFVAGEVSVGGAIQSSQAFFAKLLDERASEVAAGKLDRSCPEGMYTFDLNGTQDVSDRLLVVGGVRVAHVDFEGSAEVEFLHSSLARVVAVAGRGKQISARIKTEQVELDVLLVQRDGLDGEK